MVQVVIQRDLNQDDDPCQHRIMISYSHLDKGITEELAKLLDRAFDNVWFDKSRQGIFLGQDWWNEILKQIGACDVFVFLISENALQSEWCQKELEEARQQQKRIIPISIRENIQGIPEWLQKLQLKAIADGGIDKDLLNELYATIIRLPKDRRSKYTLTENARLWANQLVYWWNEHKIEQSFFISEVLMMMNQREMVYGHGILDDEVRKSDNKPPLAVLKELAQNNLIIMNREYSASSDSRWEIVLREDLKQAVANDFR